MTIKTNHLSLATYWSDRTTRGCIETETIAARPAADYRLSAYVSRALPGVDRVNYCNEGAARHALNVARHAIAFMDATGLSGSRAWRSIFPRLPSGFDHTEVWQIDGRYLVTTEPYGNADRAAAWCKANGWQCAERPAWGMWNPPATTLLLCVPPKRGADLGAILKALDAATPIPFAERETVGKVYVSERRVAA